MRKTGTYQIIGPTRYFVPDPLPPHDPDLTLDIEMLTLYGEAMLQLGKLNEMAEKLPNVQSFIKAYVIKEALLSSSIEGIHTTLLDVFTQPLLESHPNKDTQLVINYTKSLYLALSMIQNKNLPISSRVILAAHEVLMQGEGDKANPGSYRKQSVRVGELIPAAPGDIAQLISQLEDYINSDQTLPELIKAGLAHVQFEIIHPFLDGNGRIGRLLIVLMLLNSKILSKPLLYPSFYFKKYHLEYYQLLDRIRTNGDYESWIKFYLKAIISSSNDAYRRAKEIEELTTDLTQAILTNDTLSTKMKDMRIATLILLFSNPIISIKSVSSHLGVSYNTAGQIIADFMETNILVQENKQKREKFFKFQRYLTILEQEYN